MFVHFTVNTFTDKEVTEMRMSQSLIRQNSIASNGRESLAMQE